MPPRFVPGETHEQCWLQCWPPWYEKEVNILVLVQERAVRMMKGLEHLSQEGRLRGLGLYSLKKSLFRGISSICINAQWED